MDLISATEAAVRAAFEDMKLPVHNVRVRLCAMPEMGDLQCDAIFSVAKGAGCEPGELAAEAAKRLEQNPVFESVTVAGKAFLNMRLKIGVLAQAAAVMMGERHLGIIQSGTDRLAVVDFGGPNVAKPLHVGHLRSLVIGQCIRRVLAAQGWYVIADAHLGDWGLQMGMLTSAIRLMQPDLPFFVEGYQGLLPTQAPLSLDEMEQAYPEASRQCKEDAGRMEMARQDTARLQAGDPGLTALWVLLRELSLESQIGDFSTLGVKFDLLMGESDAQPMIAPMLEDLRSRGLIIPSEGAQVIEVELPGDRKAMPPFIVQKSDGAALYATTDLATLQYRAQVMNASLCVYVTDMRQSLHFEQLFRAAAKTGLGGNMVLHHIAFGTVNGVDGKPYRTRDGGVARLRDMLDETVAKALERIEVSGRDQDMSPSERMALACKVGIAAVKFADLSSGLSGYQFDLDRMVAFEGKTGPYLQYACVRIRSILSKATHLIGADTQVMVTEPSERALLLACLLFPSAVADVGKQMHPGGLAEYAYKLAQAFAAFYAACPVLTAEGEVRASRLTLCRLSGRVLERSLDLLGIDIPEWM